MKKDKKPNIIMIMTDQQRGDTIHALGNKHMITPNMDRLVKKGVSFTQCFSCGATCISARAAIFTGLYPHNTGVYSFNCWAHQRLWVDDLRESGYHCVNIGKMHFSPRHDNKSFHERIEVENPTTNFLRNGGIDDEWGRHLALHGKKRPLDRHISDPDWNKKYQGVAWHMDEHLHSDVFIGNKALAWINNYEQGKPVFLQIGFTGPHEPYDPLPRHLDMYKDKDIPMPVRKEGELEKKPPQHKGHQYFFSKTNHEARIQMQDASDKDIKHMRQHYYAKITTIDEKLGEILDALEKKGFLGNALVIFISDHGDMVGDHFLPYKWLMYDSITNVPLIIWDTQKKANYSIKDLVSHIDLGPTILDYANIPVPIYLEGHSLMNYISGKKNKPEKYVFCEDNYLTMVRSKDFKLVYYTFQEEEGELYDLKKDPGELNNLFNDNKYAEEKHKMIVALFNWIIRSNYKTAGHKIKDKHQPLLWPEEHSYLHPGVLWTGWDK